MLSAVVSLEDTPLTLDFTARISTSDFLTRWLGSRHLAGTKADISL